MKTNETIHSIAKGLITLCKSYLAEEIGPLEFIREDHNVVNGDNFPWEDDNAVVELLEEFHDDLSMYVPNPSWRNEDPGYYGEDKLQEKTTQLLKILEKSISN